MATGEPAGPDPQPGYAVAAGSAEGELRDKGSRFVAFLRPAGDEAAAKAALDAIAAQHPDATHHCFAWRLGAPPRERSSDAGEPAGTAGMPILHVLRGAELSDVMAVVVRWYGGTKLGKGGLARAYAGAARLALEELSVVRRIPTEYLTLQLPYERLGAVKRLIHPPAVELVDESYGAAVTLVLAVHSHRRRELDAALADLGLAPDPRCE